jgi:hypothetical protein
MSRLKQAWHAATRGVDRVFDALGSRPLGIVVFAGSALLLFQLQIGGQGAIRAEAVAQAQHVDHPARVGSFVIETFVQPGDVVEIGTPLVQISSHFIDQEIARVDTEITKLIHERGLARARLLIEEQRWLNPNVRLRPQQPSLEEPTEALFTSEIQVMQIRRAQLLENIEGLTIKSSHSGRVSRISATGSAVSAGTSVASVTPVFAEELVAYVPPETEPASIRSGAEVQISRSLAGSGCAGSAVILRPGAEVMEAPGQLRTFLRFPVHGMPVHISIPQGCRLGVGQIVSVEFSKAVM